MKRLAILAVALTGLLAVNAQAASTHLTAGPELRVWHSPQRFGPEDAIELAVYVHGVSLTEWTGRECEIEWVGKGVAVRASLCGKRKAPLTLHYVSLGGRVTFGLVYSRPNRFSRSPRR